MELAAARRDLHETLLRMVRDRLVVGSAGNVSVRLGDGSLVVSAGGRLYQHLSPNDHPLVDIDTGVVRNGLPPTSELALHLAVMRAFPEVHSVVHTHSPYAAGWSIARLDLDFVCNENIGPAGERILVTDPYAAPGTTDLADATVATLKRQPGSRACLLANHGPLAVGPTLEAAYTIAQQVEWVAHVAFVARSLGPLHVIEPEHQDTIGATYGFTVARQADGHAP